MPGPALSRPLSLLAVAVTLLAPAAARARCEPGEVLNALRRSTKEAEVRAAADCVGPSAPAETTRVLLDRLDQTLAKIRRTSPRWPATDEARIAAALAQAAARAGHDEGFAKITAYFTGADWASPRDVAAFNSLDAALERKAGLAEVYYLALTRLPVSVPHSLAAACRAVQRQPDASMVGEEPRFTRALLSALTRVERAQGVPDRQYATHACEEALRSRLVVDPVREAFLAGFRDQLSADERARLDRFLAEIVPDSAGLVERFASVLLAVPWRTPLADFKRRNQGLACEPFRGTSYVTRGEDLWCARCASQGEPFEQRFDFYPDRTEAVCTLQRVRLSQPTVREDTIGALTTRLNRAMGSGRPAGEVSGSGSAWWRDVTLWKWKGLEVLAFVNADAAGEQAPRVEVLARDRGLIASAELEEAADLVLARARELRAQATRERLRRDVARSLPDLVRRLDKARDASARYALLVGLLGKAAKAGPQRAAHLLLGDRLAGELAKPTLAGRLKDWDGMRKALATHGIEYVEGIDGFIYTHGLRRKIVDEGLGGYWAEEAFLESQLAGWAAGGPCATTDQWREVIDRGEAYLKTQPTSRIRKWLVLSLAQAHETAWSLSLAGPEDEYVNPDGYGADAPAHRARAITYYEEFLREYPDTAEAVLARPKLVRLRLGFDTNSRAYYCIYD